MAKNLAADWSQVFPPLPVQQPLTKVLGKKPSRKKAVSTPPRVAHSPSVSSADMPRLKGISLRQPWAEQVIRGDKVIEYRQRPVKHRGRIYIYASLGRYSRGDEAEMTQEFGYQIDDLARGVVIGSVEIVECTDEGFGDFGWHLANPQRLETPQRNLERVISGD